MLVAVDFLGMREYARINPQLKNLDTLYALLVESDIIPMEVTQRCEIEFSLTSRNLQVVLTAKTSSDQQFCSDTSASIAEVIDNPRVLTSYIPDAFQFATAAVAGSSLFEVPAAAAATAAGTIIQSYLIICATILSTLLLTSM